MALKGQGDLVGQSGLIFFSKSLITWKAAWQHWEVRSSVSFCEILHIKNK